MVKPMPQRILDWVEACTEKPLELPAMFGIIREFATVHADEIEKVMPSTGQFAEVYEDQLESSALFGAVGKDMIRVVFDPQVAHVINALAAIRVERDGFEQDRDFALAFLYARGEHIHASEKLSGLAAPLSSRMSDHLQEHQDLLASQGLDVAWALSVIAEDASATHAREVGNSPKAREAPSFRSGRDRAVRSGAARHQP